MDKKKKIIVGSIIAGSGIAYALSRKKTPPLTEPAILYGKVTDAQTGAALQGIQVKCGTSYSRITGADGTYRIENIVPGYWPITFTDPNLQYQPEEQSLTLWSGLRQLNMSLNPIPIQTEWSVEGIEPSPQRFYVGEITRIDVHIQACWTEQKLPIRVHVEVQISNGVVLTNDFIIDFCNPALPFFYTPTGPGTYTVTVTGSTPNMAGRLTEEATFVVETPIPVPTIYSPFGTVDGFSSENSMLESDFIYAGIRYWYAYSLGGFVSTFPFTLIGYGGDKTLLTEPSIDYSAFPPVSYKGPLMSSSSHNFNHLVCKYCGYEYYRAGLPNIGSGCPNCGSTAYRTDPPSSFYIKIESFNTHGFIGGEDYLGGYWHAYSCALCGTYFYQWYEIQTGPDRVNTFNEHDCLMALYVHITDQHSEYSWDKPKGGVVLVAPGLVPIWDEYWHRLPPPQISGFLIFGGIVLLPGSYDLESPYNHVEIPDWGDRYYINMQTGERVLVKWDEMLNAPKAGPWPDPV